MSSQASEVSLRWLSCLRLQHGWRLPRGSGLGRFAALQSLTLFHAYALPGDVSEDSNGDQVYQVRGLNELRSRQYNWSGIGPLVRPVHFQALLHAACCLNPAAMCVMACYTW